MRNEAPQPAASNPLVTTLMITNFAWWLSSNLDPDDFATMPI